MNAVTKFKLSDIRHSRELKLHIEKGLLNSDFMPHTHDFCELFFVVGGSALHTSNGLEYAVARGDIFAVKGSDVHGFTRCKNFALYNVMFPLEDYAPREELRRIPGFWAMFLHGEYIGTTSYAHLDAPDCARLENLCAAMCAEYSAMSEGCAPLCRAMLTEIIIYASRAASQGGQGIAGANLHMARAVSFLESHYCDEIALSDAAEFAKLSVRHMARLFRATYGMTPLEYVGGLRAARAKELLADSPLTITEIATQCGYSDSNYFSRAFKRREGATPAAYRRAMRKA